ncbi:ketosynthase chain-length factor [Paractinoplanes ferrugineus]|uniref:Actinorhodin polyketide beta-ketoacyl synthase n=1 Tax=Paractinoplanes ferrugineus TaxID=113564 RepID=A0A919J9I9_9ACTN|nr:ketosynthase chain-length factor [Actinoplanes ferrugineus]GIE16250.1 actinorhodin polyketide beta-ketoacyl synthase [Actinoplanes ferrugineus]
MNALVTGLGVVAPNGIGAPDYWSAVRAGTSGLGPLTRFDATDYPVSVAGEVKDFVATDHIPGALAVQTDQWTHLGLVAAELALADGGVDPGRLNEYEMAVVTASSSGGTEFGQREIEALWRRGPRHVGPYQSIAWFYAATTGQISIRHGMRGPCGVIANEQAGGLDALAQARRLIRDGAKVVVAGGADSALCPYGLVAQLSTGNLTSAGDPATAYQPFGAQAAGYPPGEGAAMLIIEDEAHAEARGAVHRYGRIAGYAATFDPGGFAVATLRRAVELALADAVLTPDDIDVVFADAAGVAGLDAAEAEVIAGVFGPCAVPVAAPKALVGRLLAGGAALDVVTALLAIRDGVIPGGATAEPATGYHLDLVAEARATPIRTALVIARGHGGFNACLIVTAP